MSAPLKRCAIYTRKSSEEGLEQDFNSLTAQREACAAYVASQTGEGWRAVPTFYDDGGYSGGTLDRPGLQRLLSDIDAGKIDIVVVYKVDRLTRSLADFAKIVERLEARSASFVSVTQSFNTTTSMGRLTLNVLLSFAQFEREVTGERIRDKIAASKRKGMWMGGYAPLGYRALGRALEPATEEAEQVRAIFQRYLVLKSVPALAEALDAEGFRSKVYVSKKGVRRGGVKIGPGPMRYILANRIYRGLIVHGKECFPGLHPPIIDAALFDAVQAQLAARALPRGKARRARPKPMLAGRVFTEEGRPIISVVTNVRPGREQRYYIPSKACAGERRIPATLFERLVGDACVRVLASDPGAGLTRVQRVVVQTRTIAIVLTPREDDIEICRARLSVGEALEDEDSNWRLTLPLQLRRWRGGTTAFDASGKSLCSTVGDAGLLKAIGRAWSWRSELQRGGVVSIAAIAKREGLAPTYVWRILQLSYLAPDLMRATLAGQTPHGLSLHRLVHQEMPRDWEAQRRLFANADPTLQRDRRTH